LTAACGLLSVQLDGGENQRFYGYSEQKARKQEWHGNQATLDAAWKGRGPDEKE
jgi:hypothetical protein